MLTIDPQKSVLLIIDFQARLMPAIHEGEAAIRNAGKLLEISKLLDVPRLFTEQYPKGLGATVPELPVDGDRVISKVSFDACRAESMLQNIPADAEVVVAGCEAHVCVLQTVLGLIAASRKVIVVRDAIGSRKPEDKAAAIARMERRGAEIVTTEMVAFEWVQTAENPRFRAVSALIK
ncbi:isochorismatase family protein [Rhodoblastus acidophilus]|uniref:Isochorismatase family protein n=1 Tax=Rhodoblastus acidophilus TaxID=1074 RepID=A0A6N8DJE3_RHOAC|nr:isochorismatase family protein [Rhodoblastus acidophilus]MCW2274087.1 nicotinamidase-related amidase [Rhodoblastus acidophilus]MTV30660.1 isochorismatase family protein [Rhodoblastus acidophilus]